MEIIKKYEEMVRLKLKVLADKESYENFKVSLKNNEGYCPCSIEKSEDTKCICKKMREDKICD